MATRVLSLVRQAGAMWNGAGEAISRKWLLINSVVKHKDAFSQYRPENLQKDWGIMPNGYLSG